MEQTRKQLEEAFPIGTKVYVCCEHLYKRDSGRILTTVEYVVCEGRIFNYFMLKSYNLIRVIYIDPEGHFNIECYETKQMNEYFWLKPKGAAEKAKRLTERYERVWGGMGYPGEYPLRRTWEHYLRGEDFTKSAPRGNLRRWFIIYRNTFTNERCGSVVYGDDLEAARENAEEKRVKNELAEYEVFEIDEMK